MGSGKYNRSVNLFVAWARGKAEERVGGGRGGRAKQATQVKLTEICSHRLINYCIT